MAHLNHQKDTFAYNLFHKKWGTHACWWEQVRPWLQWQEGRSACELFTTRNQNIPDKIY